jgi:predicted nuclease of predicted toxin-antitoxin system
MAEKIRFLADESCDFTVVRSLRAAGYDVVAVTESFPSASDIEVLRAAVENDRVLITEDSDFGEWVFAHRKKTNGVIFIRFPGNIRLKLGQMVLSLVEKHGTELIGNFTVLEPGRARIRKSPLSL